MIGLKTAHAGIVQVDPDLLAVFLLLRFPFPQEDATFLTETGCR
jgi:hypothetical protein